MLLKLPAWDVLHRMNEEETGVEDGGGEEE